MSAGLKKQTDPNVVRVVECVDDDLNRNMRRALSEVLESDVVLDILRERRGRYYVVHDQVLDALIRQARKTTKVKQALLDLLGAD